MTPTRIVLPLLALALATGCASTDHDRPATESNLTAGMAKLTIRKDQTRQAEILEVFGPPDMVTHRDGLEVWTYDKIRHDLEQTAVGLAVGGGGGGGSGGGLGGLFGSRHRTTASSTSTILIIYFDDRDVVRDYRMQVTRF